MKIKRRTHGRLAALTALLLVQTAVFAHVTIAPRESGTGAEQRYTVRVPTERDTPTVRIEAKFPDELFVASVDAKNGWRVETTVAPDGRIVSAVWSGGRIAPHESDAFTIVARNPARETTLVWDVVQLHEDGTRAEWIGAQGSRNPAPITIIRGVESAAP